MTLSPPPRITGNASIFSRQIYDTEAVARTKVIFYAYPVRSESISSGREKMLSANSSGPLNWHVLISQIDFLLASRSGRDLYIEDLIYTPYSSVIRNSSIRLFSTLYVGRDIAFPQSIPATHVPPLRCGLFSNLGTFPAATF